jgi:hypothetical protein
LYSGEKTQGFTFGLRQSSAFERVPEFGLAYGLPEVFGYEISEKISV